VDECKPLPDLSSAMTILGSMRASNQGLTLVNFSVQLELCLTQKSTLHIINTP